MQPLSIGVWLDDLHLGLKESLQRVASWSCEVLGLDAFRAELNPRALSDSGRRDLARLLRSSGGRLVAVRADVGGRRLADPATLDTGLGRMRHAFELARDLSALRVAVPLGFVPPAEDGGHDRTRACLKEAVGALLSLSNHTGVGVAALAGREPAAQLRALLDECDSAGQFEVDLHPGTWLSLGQDPVAALNTLSSRVIQASVADHFKGGSEAPFGRGDVVWPEVLIGLSALSRPNPIALLASCTRECDRPAALQHTVTRLHQLRINPLA